jgi:hypothetical protein
VPEIDHRVGEGLERVMQPADALEAQQQPAELSSQANTCSIVRKRSLKMAGSKIGLRPAWAAFCVSDRSAAWLLRA